MSEIEAFIRGMNSDGKELMIFDWDKAATMIKEKNPKVARAGLMEDWEMTSGEIYKDGKIIPEKDTYVWLVSTWAKPCLNMDGVSFECYGMKSEINQWNNSTYWPKTSLNILEV